MWSLVTRTSGGTAAVEAKVVVTDQFVAILRGFKCQFRHGLMSCEGQLLHSGRPHAITCKVVGGSAWRAPVLWLRVLGLKFPEQVVYPHFAVGASCCLSCSNARVDGAWARQLLRLA